MGAAAAVLAVTALGGGLCGCRQQGAHEEAAPAQDVSNVMIGMSYNEVIQAAGEPVEKQGNATQPASFSGALIYNTAGGKAQVRFENGKVTAIQQ